MQKKSLGPCTKVKGSSTILTWQYVPTVKISNLALGLALWSNKEKVLALYHVANLQVFEEHNLAPSQSSRPNITQFFQPFLVGFLFFPVNHSQQSGACRQEVKQLGDNEC